MNKLARASQIYDRLSPSKRMWAKSLILLRIDSLKKTPYTTDTGNPAHMRSQHAPQTLTVTETAEIFGVTPRAIRQWIATGKLTATMHGGIYFIPLKSVEALKEKRRRQQGHYPTGDA